MDDFLKALRVRPEGMEIPKEIQFQIVDVNIQDKAEFLAKGQKRKTHLPKQNNYFSDEKKGNYSTSKSNIVSIFGTTESGHSLCIIVQNFTPYFDVCIDASWERSDIQKIVSYVQKKIHTRFSTTRLPETRPTCTSRPKRTWARGSSVMSLGTTANP